MQLCMFPSGCGALVVGTKKNGVAGFIQGWGLNTVGFFSEGERLGPTLNITRKNGNLKPRTRVGVNG